MHDKTIIKMMRFESKDDKEGKNLVCPDKILITVDQMKLFRYKTILFIILVFLVSFSARSEMRGGEWHYFAGFNVACVRAFHTSDSRIPVRIPFGAVCGAMNDHIGVYARISLSPTINTKLKVDNVSQMVDMTQDQVLPDGRVSMKSVFNQLVAGPVVNLGKGFSVFCGVGGYQMRAYVRNVEDDYVRVSDRCSASLAIDAGVMYHYRHIFFTGGTTLCTAKWTDNSPYAPFWSGNLTVGYFF